MGPFWVMCVYSYADNYGAFCDASAKATSNRMTGTVVELTGKKVATCFRACGVIAYRLDRCRVYRLAKVLFTEFCWLLVWAFSSSPDGCSFSSP